ncbi:MAG TPA: BatA domain-containing protein [Gemmatimonadaceae bacterium]|nr:BatA domain-containing protein [Gemmatimonadaceae bacterium]
MSFLAPGFFYAALAVAAGVVALHFIVTRQPRAAMLPTARFVPNLPATATARATRPSDMLLLAMRALLVLAAGTALARPVFRPPRGPVARLVLLDVSKAVADMAAATDSARSIMKSGDALVVYDSTARSIAGSAIDSLPQIRATNARSNLSAALIAAIRTGSMLRERADSIELVIISPFAEESWDAATDSLRALWKGRARLVHVSIAVDTATAESPSIATQSSQADPLVATLALMPRVTSVVRFRRNGITTEDSTWAASGHRVLVEWPATERPSKAIGVQRADTSGGVVAGDAITIAAFTPRWRYPTDSLRGHAVVARWMNGEPVAIEKQIGDGCHRSIAIPVTGVGDLVIRSDFQRIATALLGPCIQHRPSVAAARPALAALAGPGGLVARDSFRAREDVRSPLAPWLMGAAIVLALLELLVRRKLTATSEGPLSRQPTGPILSGRQS